MIECPSCKLPMIKMPYIALNPDGTIKYEVWKCRLCGHREQTKEKADVKNGEG